MTSELSPLPPVEARDGARKISPTDVAQFVRFEQCERMLRFALHGRNADYNWMQSAGLYPQSLAPLLQGSGRDFEDAVESALGQGSGGEQGASSVESLRSFAARSTGGQRRRDPNNEAITQAALDLRSGQSLWLAQPRVAVRLGEWDLRGDIDLLRLKRDDNGSLQVLVADMKSSSRSRVEHKLQVAFYHEMLREMFGAENIAHEPIEIGILYRGPLDASPLEPEALALLEEHKSAARKYFGAQSEGFYDATPDKEAFLRAVRELVTGEDSVARRVSQAPFESLSWHLGSKCDGCSFNEWCLSSAAQNDDLVLLPHLDEDARATLRKHGVSSISDLASLKRLKTSPSTCTSTNAPDPEAWNELETVPEQAERVRALSATRGLGHRLDELIHRAIAFRVYNGGQAPNGEEDGPDSRPRARARWKRNLPAKGYGTLPFCGPEHNPNLVSLIIDAQYDHLNERVYALGARLLAHRDGELHQTRTVIEIADGPPQTHQVEQQLFVRWIESTLRALGEIAAPDQNGEARAPLHLVFFDRREQKELLEGLGRQFESIVGATPLFDFVTQIASLDSTVVTFLDEEMRDLKNYPRTCSSLYETASFLGFDWNEPRAFRRLFHERVFDGVGKMSTLDDGDQWFQKRARFGSGVPLEYAHAAWGLLPTHEGEERDDPFSGYRQVSLDDLRAFHERRLDAIAHIASDFKGNKQTSKTSFDLSILSTWDGKAATLAHALDEFLAIERHAELGAWKRSRQAHPEHRALAGDTLLCKYFDGDQSDETRARMQKMREVERERAAFRESNPDEKLPPELRGDLSEMRVRLRLQGGAGGVGPDEVLSLSSLSEGERVVLSPRWEFDSRLPEAERFPFQPTAKQMLYDARAEITSVARPDQDGGELWVELEIAPPRGVKAEQSRGYVFIPRHETLEDGALFCLDPDPSDWYGYFQKSVVEGLVSGEHSPLLSRLEFPELACVDWPEEAELAQKKFLRGLEERSKTDGSLKFEEAKREFIGSHGGAPFLLVQGPPGTGKSYATSWALWARMQGALAAGIEWRALLSCKTHAAVDVLLRNLRGRQEELREIQKEDPALFAKYFDARLLEIPLFRFAPKRADGWDEDGEDRALIPLYAKDGQKERGEERADKLLAKQRNAFVGATPGGVYRMCKDAGKLWGRVWFHALVIDEASQMGLPEAMMAALALDDGAPLIVVGDPRQMPPIVKHDWQSETRRTFGQFKAFASLYDTIDALDKPMQGLEGEGKTVSVPRIRFSESFRLHRDMAAFLRREIYQQDNIRYFSRRTSTVQVLAEQPHDDAFVRAVLRPEFPLVVVLHDEDESVLENPFEARLMAPVLEALSGEDGLGLDASKGLGVVVPHRAQRALMRDARWNVDTIERFQGDERQAMLFCATESDRSHLQRAGAFLFDPRRLNVALSRAKQKMILVASKSIFTGFSPNEETFANAQLWKNLLHQTCTHLLHEAELENRKVQVWGNVASDE
jgi:hypothetical protein